MIAHIRGQLIEKTPTSSIIESAGIGYEVFHTPFTAEKLVGKEVSLHIHSHIREDLFQLFGFSERDEREAFRQLVKVSSVGPKLALGILSGIYFPELIHAIESQDLSRLQKIPGIGKRTAERLAVELRNKFGAIGGDLQLDGFGESTSRESELESVLVNLGYQRAEILKAVKTVRKTEEKFEDFPLEAMVKSTLGVLTVGKLN